MEKPKEARKASHNFLMGAMQRKGISRVAPLMDFKDTVHKMVY